MNGDNIPNLVNIKLKGKCQEEDTDQDMNNRLGKMSQKRKNT
jgi:hypothetical protein